MVSIRVYQTHIEIYPYCKGDSERLEKSLSKFNKVYHRWEPVSYYWEDNVLFIPRGISLSLLQSIFHSNPIYENEVSSYASLRTGEMLVSPKSTMQKDAIDFLSVGERFGQYKGKSQFMLNLDTGDGKTIAALSAMFKHRYRTMIIVHQNKIKEQWLDTIRYKTSLPLRNVMDIRGSEMITAIMKNATKEKDVYIVNHQTLASYAREHGWYAIRELFDHL